MRLCVHFLLDILNIIITIFKINRSIFKKKKYLFFLSLTLTYLFSSSQGLYILFALTSINENLINIYSILSK